jgi:hypothetical protein
MNMKRRKNYQPQSWHKRWEPWVLFAVAVLTIVSTALDLPEKIHKVLRTDEKVAASHLRGLVTNSEGEPIAEAIVTIAQLPGDTLLTTSDGGFYFAKVPGNLGERVRVYLDKAGYKRLNVYVTLPGPAKLILEKE